MIRNENISIVLPDLRGGGAEKLHVNLANDWVEKGRTVEFILMREEGQLLKLLSPKITIVDLKVNRMSKMIIPLVKHFRKKNGVILSAMWPLTSITLISWALSGKRQKIFLSDHNHLSISCIQESGVPKIIIRFFIWCTYPFASKIIAVSKGVKKDIQNLGKIPSNQIEVIYNPAAKGGSLLQCSKLEIEDLWGESFDYHILAIGSLENQKNFIDLIKSFSLFCKEFNAKLIILGEGSQRGILEKLALELNVSSRVAMPGFVDNPYPWIMSADLFVLSSKWEGFGNVIVEALECGLPVVSTNCKSGPSEILDNGRYGLLVPVGNINALAMAMQSSLLKEHDSELLINRSKEFLITNISDKYLKLFYGE